VVVLGGGFGGVYTALRLAELAGTYSSDPNPLSITVVDARDRFVFLPLLYELATGTASEAEVAPLLTDVLGGSGANFLQGTVTAVNLEKRTVTIGTHAARAAAEAYSGKADDNDYGESAAWPSSTSSDDVGGLEATETTTTTLSFDRLVVAMGAEAAPPLTVPGAIEHAMPFYTV
jgi:NADH dehydrogenase FAD-containing subunit